MPTLGRGGNKLGDDAEVDRLRALVAKLGPRAGLGEDDLAALDIAASMIGVKGLPTLDITRKAGPLTPEDRARMKEVTDIWAEFAGQLSLLRDLGVARLLETYTEHWDGRGGPAGLSGEDIPPASRVLSVCYHYNGMTSDRSYRAPLSNERAAAELGRMSGTVLDPRLVETFLEMTSASAVQPMSGKRMPPRGPKKKKPYLKSYLSGKKRAAVKGATGKKATRRATARLSSRKSAPKKAASKRGKKQRRGAQSP